MNSDRGFRRERLPNSSSPDVIRAMSTELFLNFLGIRMDSRKAEGLRFTINLITPDNGEKFLVELENASAHQRQGLSRPRQAGSHPHDQSLGSRANDDGVKILEAQIADGTAKVEGDASILKQLASTMVDFDPRFEIMPGTKVKTEVTGYVEFGIKGKADPYEAVPRQTIAE